MSLNQREKQALKTKNKIVKVALKLIKEDGYHNMSIRQLCQEAGISTGAFYHHFNSKEEIINKAFGLYDAELEEVLENHPFQNPIEDIRFILLNQTEFILRESGNFTKELYIAQLSTSDKYSVNPDRKIYRVIKDLVTQAKQERLITSNMMVEEISQFLLRTTRGVTLDWCLNDYSYDLCAQTQKDLDLVLTVLTAPSHDQ